MTATVVSTVNSSTSTGTTMSVTLPSLTNGNRLIMIVGYWNTAPATPSGWTQIEKLTSGNMNVAAFTRVVDGTEGSSVSLSGFASGESRTATVHDLSGAGAINISTALASSGTRDIPGVTTTVADCLILRGFYTQDQTGTQGYTWSAGTEIADFSGPVGAGWYGHQGVATQVQASAGATGTMTVTPSGTTSSNWGGVTIAVEPGSGGGGGGGGGGAVPAQNGVSYNNSSATTLTINYPGTSSSGDLVILGMHASFSAAAAKTFSPDGGGWTSLEIWDNSAADGVLHQVWWKFRGAETSVTVSVSPNASTNGLQGVIVSYPAAQVDSVAPVGANASAFPAVVGNSTTTPGAATSPAMTTVVNNAQILHIAFGFNSTNATLMSQSWSGGTEISDNTSTISTRAWGISTATDDLATAGAVTQRTVSYSPSTGITARWIASVAVLAPHSYPGKVAAVTGLSHANGTTRNITMPTAATGDLLLAMVDIDGPQTISTATSGWTKIGQYQNSSTPASNDTIAVFAGVKGTAAEPLVVTNTTTKHSAWQVHSIRRWSGSVSDIGIASGQGSSTNPDPPSLSPSYGANNTLWFAVTLGTNPTTGTPTAAPTGFNELLTSRCTTGTTSTDVGFSSAWRWENAASKDPAAFTMGTSHQWLALTIAVPPSLIVPKSDTDSAGVSENATVTINTPSPGPTEIAGASATGTGADLTINYPAGSLSGDYLVAMVHFYKTTGTTAPAVTTPSGWTLLQTQNAGGTDPYMAALYGRFRGAETSVTFSATSGTNVQSTGELFAYRGVDAGVPVTASALTYALDTDNTYAAPTVTTTSANNKLWKGYVSHGEYQSTPAASWPAGSEYTDRAITVAGSRQLNMSTSYGLKTTAGSTGTETVTQAASLLSVTPRGMDKSGTQSITSGAQTTKITGFAAQSGTPGGAIVNDELIVSGTGKIIVTGHFTWSGAPGGTTNSLRIYKNGVEVASNAALTGLSGATRTDATWAIGWMGDVVDGDSIAVYFNRTGTGTARNITAGFLKYDLVPDIQFASDTFDGTGARSSDWTTTGGGTLVRTSGELDGTGTPSTPLSYAWHDNAPTNPAYVRVKTTQRKNGRNPEHSSWGPVVRASPGDDHGNPGEENGVQFAMTDSIMVMLYEDFSTAEGWVAMTPTSTPYLYIGPTGYADGSVLEIIAINDYYYAVVNGTIVMTGTSNGAIDQTNTVVGAMIQNDQLEPGGGQPPANLDDWVAYYGTNTSSGAAHTFAGTVALQEVQNSSITDTDSAGVSETQSISATNPTQTDSAGAAEAETVSATMATQTDSAGATEAETLAANVPVTDSAGVSETETVTATVADSDSAGATEWEQVSNSVLDTDSAGATDAVAGIGVADSDSAGGTDLETGVGFDSAGVSEAESISVFDTDSAGATDDAQAASAVQGSDSAGATDDVVSLELIATDSFGATDSETGVGQDAAGATEFEYPIGITETDSAGVSEAEWASVSVVDSDSAGATEAEFVTVADADTAGASDIETVSAAIAVTDSAGATDAHTDLTAQITQSDSFGAADDVPIMFQFSLTDSFGATDVELPLQVAVSSTDSFGATDAANPVLLLVDADSFGADDLVAFRTSDLLTGLPRVRVAEVDDRVLRVERERRRLKPKVDVRVDYVEAGY